MCKIAMESGKLWFYICGKTWCFFSLGRVCFELRETKAVRAFGWDAEDLDAVTAFVVSPELVSLGYPGLCEEPQVLPLKLFHFV